MLWEPLRFLESCPPADGACAVVIGDADAAKAGAAGVRRRGSRRRRCSPSSASSPAVTATRPPGRRRLRPRRLPAGGHHQPARAARRGRAVRAVHAGTSRCGSRATASPGPARAGRWSTAARPRSPATFPVNSSGGVLSCNPIGASGLLRFAEAANQVRGQAGEHQVAGAKVSLGQAYGANAQYFAMAHLQVHRPGLTSRRLIANRCRTWTPISSQVRRCVWTLPLPEGAASLDLPGAGTEASGRVEGDGSGRIGPKRRVR